MLISMLTGAFALVATQEIEWGHQLSFSNQTEEERAVHEAVAACSREPIAQRSSYCSGLLATEANLLPDEAFPSADSSAYRGDGWAQSACTLDRLAPGQTTGACREEQERLYNRSYRARRVLAGETLLNRVPTSPSRATGASQLDAERIEDTSSPDNCDRRSSMTGDESGSASSSYALTCSWFGGDPEEAAASRELLDRMQSGDRR